MIGKVKGTLVEVQGNVGLVETQMGIAYEILLTPRALASPIGTAFDIHTHLQVKEDSHTLFGFDDYSQKVLFKLLIGVSGVGPKSAFGIVSFSSATSIIAAIRDSDTAYFSRMPGVGKKTAMKIIVELSSKLKGAIDESKLFITDDTKIVLDALVSLGYPAAEARSIVNGLPSTMSVEQMITEALKQSGSAK
jgi:Holliday junction DNA helicase RuvA